MIRLPRRAGRRALFSAGLAAAVTLSLAGVALAGSGSQAAAAGRTDAYIRDVAGDIGNQPDTAPGNYYESPDIRSCNTAILCATDQQPIPGGTSYVFVNVNVPGPYGTGPSSGTLHVYYTTMGGAAQWPMDWTPITPVALTAYPGVTQVTVPWVGVPTVPGLHFCLLARWVSATDPMVFEGPNTMANVVANNNDAWHNISAFHFPWNGGVVRQPFALGNVAAVRTVNDLVFTEPADHFGRDGGVVVADLGPLFDGWMAAGGRGVGIKPIGGTEVQILDPASARISGLTVDPGTRPQISLEFSASQAATGKYVLDVDQMGPAEKDGGLTDLGGVGYHFTGADR